MKKYLTFTEKMSLIDSIVEISVKNGEYNPLNRNLAEVIYITKEYFEGYDFIKDNEGEIDFISSYDKLMKSNWFNVNIYKNIPENEKELLSKLIDDSIKEKLRQETSITGFINRIVNMDLNGVLKGMESLDKDKLKYILELVKQNNGSSK